MTFEDLIKEEREALEQVDEVDITAKDEKIHRNMCFYVLYRSNGRNEGDLLITVDRNKAYRQFDEVCEDYDCKDDDFQLLMFRSLDDYFRGENFDVIDESASEDRRENFNDCDTYFDPYAYYGVSRRDFY